MGYSQQELEAIQERWNLRFPPDLVELLQEHRPLLGGENAFDWLISDPAKIQAKLDWPFEGFCFDLEHNRLWWSEWGHRPDRLDDQRARLREIFAGVPPLIPLFGHRYLPAEPCERGNPVFSVYQADIICYGANLQDWLTRERGQGAGDWPPLKEIRFWSEAVRKNNAPP